MIFALNSVQIAKVGVENSTYGFDKLFSYRIPDTLTDVCLPGCRVFVPFGRGNMKRQAFVFSVESLSDEAEQDGLKEITELLDSQPILNREGIAIALYLTEATFCTYFEAVRALLPRGLVMKTVRSYRLCIPIERLNSEKFSEDENAVLRQLEKRGDFVSESVLLKALGNNGDISVLQSLLRRAIIDSNREVLSGSGEKNVSLLRLTDTSADAQMYSLTDKQTCVYELLREVASASVKEICYYAGCSSGVISALVKKGAVEFFDVAIDRSVSRQFAPDKAYDRNLVLSASQQKVYDDLLSAYRRQEPKTALLFGVTGSGKTGVYLKLIEQVLLDGRNCIVMVPEISLTPQTLHVFSSHFGSNVAVLHSSLSVGERYDEWQRIRRGEVRIVVGTRSAVFAPLENIGLIVMDEEQEHTYKSEMSPRYHARDVAKFRCKINNALLLLASATPSVESYAHARSGHYLLCELTERYGSAKLPIVKTVDMSDKTLRDPFFSLSKPLAAEIARNLERKEQTILLMNRRGYNTFVVCSACKKVMSCPSCSISLTFHAANNRLMCHYCGYSTPFAMECPSCGEQNIRYSGVGTQRLEEELAHRFHDAKILRMDADTVGVKHAHADALGAFERGEYDILLGTQMIAKGLDFPNVTLVGVVNIDQQIYNDDFRASENTFDLLTQVIGRAGRASVAGRAVIQTLVPGNGVLALAAKQDYKQFFENEIALRKSMIYPPYCDICVLGFSGTEQSAVFCAAKIFLDQLIELNNKRKEPLKMIALGPQPPRVAKVSNKFRQRVLIKCKNTTAFRAFLAELLKWFDNNREFKNIGIFADINPSTSV